MYKPRIAFITNPLDSTFKSSISIVTLALASRLRDDFDVTIFVSKGDHHRDKRLDGISVVRLSATPDRSIRRVLEKLQFLYSRKMPYFSSFLYYPWYAIQLAFSIRRGAYDIVHLHNFTQFIGPIKALNPLIKVVLHMHSEWLTQLDRTMISRRLKSADAILACSPFITDGAARAFPEHSRRCATLLNGVDAPGKNDSARLEKSIKEILYVGRISPEKGVHDLLEAFSKVIKDHPEARLTIAGQERVAPKEFLSELSEDEKLKSLYPYYEGSYLNILRERYSSIMPFITFAGQVHSAELPRYYGKASVYVSPSIYESFGMTVIEAMAHGLPVVATRAGVAEDALAATGAGIVVERSDPRALAHAINTVLESREMALTLGKRGREAAMANFGWDCVVKELKRVYAGLLDCQGTKGS